MITDTIIQLIYNIFMFVFGGAEPLSFNLDVSFIDAVTDFFAFIFYIIPINSLLPIITIFISLMGFRIIISLVKTIWDLLPIL